MATDHHDHDPVEAARNARSGLLLFLIYCLLYGGFIGLAAFGAQLLSASKPIAGINLAVIYGFGLIIAALVLAVIYMRSCRAPTATRPER